MAEEEEILEEDQILQNIRKAGLYYEEDISEKNIPKDILDRVPSNLAGQYRMVPVSYEDGVLTVVTDSEETFRYMDQIAEKLHTPVQIQYAEEENVKMALLTYYNITNYRQILRVSSVQAQQQEVDTTPLKRKVNEMLNFAIDQGANDLHIQPYSNGVFVSMRINGFVEDVSDRYAFLPQDGPFIVNILKSMDKSGKADPTNINMPNEGRFDLVRGNLVVECRLETVPLGTVLNGMQKVDIRFMPQNQHIKTLENIYSGSDLATIRRTLFKGGSGLFLISGPVGTGKSTALYACINYLWDQAFSFGHRLIVYTIENPIEILDERFTQVQVRLAQQEELSLTGQKALKAALRSDPDVILYGEIRDREDAEVAMKASQTGLKMFSTIHAGDSIRTINRLLDLDVSTMSLLAELKIIICQRLIGVLCPECSHEHHLTEEEKGVLTDDEIARLTAPGVKLMERGSKEEQARCPNHCQNGLIGRVAVPEYVVFDDELRDALLNMKDFRKVRSILKEHGFVSMWDKGLAMVGSGQAELADVIQKIGRD